MKSPAEYVEAASAAAPLRLGPQISTVDAEQAVAAALADAEKYRTLLLRALRNTTPTTQSANAATPAHE